MITNSKKTSVSTFIDNAQRMQAIRQKRAKELMENRKFARIPSANIRYVDLAEGDAELLQAVVEAHGILSPISVCGPYSDGTYKIIDGVRRFKAFMQIPGADQIDFPCYIVDKDVDEEERQILALAANAVHRKDDTGLIYAYIELYERKAAYGEVREDEVSTLVSDATGLTNRHVRDFRKVWRKGSPDLIDAVGTDIPVSTAAKIADSWPEDKAEQTRRLESYVSTPRGQKGKARKELELAAQAQKQGKDPVQFSRKKRIDYLSKLICKSLQELLDEEPKKSEVKPVIYACKNFIREVK